MIVQLRAHLHGALSRPTIFLTKVKTLFFLVMSLLSSVFHVFVQSTGQNDNCNFSQSCFPTMCSKQLASSELA